MSRNDPVAREREWVAWGAGLALGLMLGMALGLALGWLLWG